MKKENPYSGKPQYLTQTEACDELGISKMTFRTYAQRYELKSEKWSKYKYYRRQDVEEIKQFLSWGAQDLIVRIETMTGKKVYLQ